MKIIISGLVFAAMLLSVSLQPKFSKNLQKSYKFIPAGLVVLEGDTLSVKSFYMINHEITNLEYREFLNDLEKQGRTEDLVKARIHNENWVSNWNNSKSFAEQYHLHPAYNDFPVVNISHEAATLYCAWLTEKLNAAPNNLGVKVKARLPFHAEIVRAGVGDKLGESYPWCHPYMQNTKGEFLANFIRILNSQVTRKDGELKILAVNSPTDDQFDVLAPSVSYRPSDLGIYNLSGNAAEMINEPGVAVGGSWKDYGYDIRLQSKRKYQKADEAVGFRVVVSWGEE